MSTALLSVKGLHVSYGPIRALRGIDLQVHAGETVAIVGANGAGKSSSLKAIAGLLTPAAGIIQFADQQTNGQPAYELARLGLGLVPEGRGVFKRMNILENLQMGAFLKSDAKAIERKLEEVFHYLSLSTWIAYLSFLINVQFRHTTGDLCNCTDILFAYALIEARSYLTLCGWSRVDTNIIDRVVADEDFG